MSEQVLKDKTVLLGVSGSIAAYKAAALCSILIKKGASVRVVMTSNATKFIAPLTFSTYTKSRTYTDTFEETFEYKVEHISLADEADIAIVAPATANIIAKMAHGIADDMLSTTLLAVKSPILVAPAMNTNMFENPATQDNIETLKKRGVHIIEPDSGLLACGVTGKGKMPEAEVLAEYVEYYLQKSEKLSGKKVLVSAGPTKEAIDPVRFISNHSTGKMGFAIAKVAAQMGATVTLVSGETNCKTPINVDRVDVVSAADMDKEISLRAYENDIIIMSAAVADFTPQNPAKEKIKKKDNTDNSIELERTVDILKKLGENKRKGQFICGFSMETENVLENSKQKLVKKNVDMIVANNLRESGAGFGTDTNIVTLITESENIKLPQMSKEEVAFNILNRI